MMTLMTSKYRYRSNIFQFQIAHVIREIRQFQQTPYKIEPIPKVLNYLLDPSRLLEDGDLYQKSLILEPRSSRLSSSYGHSLAASIVASKHQNAI